jgi:hypothetical protein
MRERIGGTAKPGGERVGCDSALALEGCERTGHQEGLGDRLLGRPLQPALMLR